MDTNITLNNLPMLCGAYIVSLNSEGSMRRRLLDLGFATGSYVVPILESPLGDPRAYKIMGSIIALRDDVASEIFVCERCPIVKSEVDTK